MQPSTHTASSLVEALRPQVLRDNPPGGRRAGEDYSAPGTAASKINLTILETCPSGEDMLFARAPIDSRHRSPLALGGLPWPDGAPLGWLAGGVSRRAPTSRGEPPPRRWACYMTQNGPRPHVRGSGRVETNHQRVSSRAKHR